MVRFARNKKIRNAMGQVGIRSRVLTRKAQGLGYVVRKHQEKKPGSYQAQFQPKFEDAVVGLRGCPGQQAPDPGCVSLIRKPESVEPVAQPGSLQSHHCDHDPERHSTRQVRIFAEK